MTLRGQLRATALGINEILRDVKGEVLRLFAICNTAVKFKMLLLSIRTYRLTNKVMAFCVLDPGFLLIGFPFGRFSFHVLVQLPPSRLYSTSRQLSANL